MLLIIGVEDIRAIQEDCKTRPLVGKYKTYLLDECQLLTPQAWSAMLKILEEPPDYVVFIFCTTNPEKIMDTILSRVQRFNFQRISNEGVYNRLIYILNNENITTYDPEAIRYIARLARGGMRDSITTLEKCLDYSSNLSYENVLKVTSNGVDDVNLMSFLVLILDKCVADALKKFNDIYMTGIDMGLFLKLFIEFIENCVKYCVTKQIQLTTLSDMTAEALDRGLSEEERLRIMDVLDSISTINRNVSSEDLRILIESWIIKICK